MTENQLYTIMGKWLVRTWYIYIPIAVFGLATGQPPLEERWRIVAMMWHALLGYWIIKCLFSPEFEQRWPSFRKKKNG